jgi:hypothetical protein
VADLIRPLRGAYPGAAIEPDSTIRNQLALLGQVGVRYGGVKLLGGGELPAARAARYGLVSAWNLDEASGARADSFGANALTDNNTVTSNPGIGGVGTAAQFTAANTESLSIADNPSVSSGDVDLWLCGWGYPDTLAAFPAMIGKWGTPPSREYLLYYDTTGGVNKFSFAVSTDGTNTAADVKASTFGSASLATWYFVFAYHDKVNDLIKISVNGGAFDSAVFSGGPLDGASGLALGGSSAGSLKWDGRLDNCAIGKSPVGGIAAVAPEIRDYLYKAGAGRDYPLGWN